MKWKLWIGKRRQSKASKKSKQVHKDGAEMICYVQSFTLRTLQCLHECYNTGHTYHKNNGNLTSCHLCWQKFCQLVFILPVLHASQHRVWAVPMIQSFLPETNIHAILSEEASLSTCCSLLVQDVLLNCQFCSLRKAYMGGTARLTCTAKPAYDRVIFTSFFFFL